MSTTLMTAPNPDISKAKSPVDVVNAMASDPVIRDAILSAFTALLTGDKALFQTRTFWAALITPVVGFLAACYAAGLDGATVGAITTVMVSGAMIVMRSITKAPVTGVVVAASKS